MSKTLNGIDLSSLEHKTPKLYFPDTVPGRIVHIDGDFLAYMVAADDSKSLADMKHNADEKMEKLRLQAGAAKAILHLTPKDSNKGGRGDIALLRQYQSNRAKIKPKFLHVIRDWMERERGAIGNLLCEADDSMAEMQYTAIANGARNLSVIASKDKDLTMVPGLLMDWDTGVINDTDTDFGFVRMDDSKSTKKIRGRGWKYFWAQMLTGDPADTISGLPKCVRPDFLNGKPKPVGPVMAINILDTVKTNKEAFELVRDLFKEYEEYHTKLELPAFTDYRDGSVISWQQAFMSEAKLLWMRRSMTDPDDVIKWMGEHCV